ncbi:hypothetical protein D1007_36897 [Hordeum vulgare]|nr:hypothetical protein D1007_36897 [Hordeum vulgare]
MMFPFFFLCIFGGQLPPFLDFLRTVLENYQIHALHLHPNLFFLLATFAYLCEGFLGVMPSLALFLTFYNMRCKEGSITRCASFRVVYRMLERFIDMMPHKNMDNLRVRWIYMEVVECNTLFAPPIGPAMQSSGWGTPRWRMPILGQSPPSYKNSAYQGS